MPSGFRAIEKRSIKIPSVDMRERVTEVCVANIDSELMPSIFKYIPPSFLIKIWVEINWNEKKNQRSKTFRSRNQISKVLNQWAGRLVRKSKWHRVPILNMESGATSWNIEGRTLGRRSSLEPSLKKIILSGEFRKEYRNMFLESRCIESLLRKWIFNTLNFFLPSSLFFKK